ncbi:hypothetical protein ABS642_00725 [Microbacterium sp. A8/3-1]|uniref:Lipoprotein LpqN n=1 Tax=Microbacterium sp. A8/3-1 TaxID=3160749 RepID=A0AAU7VZL3_9MICO
MADPTPPPEGAAAQMVAEISAVRKSVGDLTGPSGTQRRRVLEDLAGRGTFSAVGVDEQTWTEADMPLPSTPFGPIVTIHLDRARVVKTVFTVLSNVQLAATSATTDVLGVIQTRLLVDGVPSAWPEMAQNSVSSGGGTGAAAYRQVGAFQTLSLTVVRDLPAGEHTLQGVLVNGHMYSTEGPGSWSGGTLQMSGPSIVVDVLQPA